ncbi:response regulator [Bdellovibrio reynosensis]|uniref:histidine kinase n=1 Tax=Bdellovibrio reynosensis TaxID=2835041 RepID=A0ABY4CAR9_9BACT|nr:response regulator [Bdellovibrio reynosensis]UOF00781.1 response regulator [Bdellovibrio reynosensis]
MENNQLIDSANQGRAGELLEQQRLLIRSHLRELEVLKRSAEESNLAKSHFLANMSHEIRTPLAAVLGFADELQQENLTDSERKDYLAAIRRNGEMLMRLIDDILDLSKIESQKIELEKSTFVLHELLDDVKKTLASKAEEKRIQLTVDLPQNLSFYGDTLRIKQILLNIIGNAVKFTDCGGVHVRTQIFDALDTGKKNTTNVIFTVSDTGAGLSIYESQKLFQPFTQADVSVTRKFGGTGLGLVISRQLARLMGGDLRLVQSQVGVGSVFEITLNLETQSQQAEKKEALGTPVATEMKISLSGKTILVVDDVSDNRFLIERYLKSHEVKLLQASNGPEALELFSKNKVDLILMDIQMPSMDGHEATRRIRKNNIDIPIIALTAHAMRDEIHKCMNSGFDAVLTKPTRRHELIELLQKWLCKPSKKTVQ